MEAITLKEVSYGIGGKNIVEDITFSVQGGEKVALLGHNGSGKSTIIDLVGQDIKPTKGSVRIYGGNLRDHKQNIGVLYDSIPLLPMLKVKELIRYISSFYPNLDKSHGESLHQMLELHRIWDRLFGKLSKGERKRVGAYLALMHKPSLLIMDEPVAELDPIMRNILWTRIFDTEGQSVLFTTHDWGEVVKKADKIIFISEGKIVGLPKKAEEWLSDPQTIPAEQKVIVPNLPEILGLLGGIPFYEESNLLHIFPQDPKSLLAQVGKYTRSFSVSVKDLKDVYLYLSMTNR